MHRVSGKCASREFNGELNFFHRITFIYSNHTYNKCKSIYSIYSFLYLSVLYSSPFFLTLPPSSSLFISIPPLSPSFPFFHSFCLCDFLEINGALAGSKNSLEERKSLLQHCKKSMCLVQRCKISVHSVHQIQFLKF